MKTLGAILFAALTISGVTANAHEARIAECKTKDVWDAGFMLQFDLDSYRGPENSQITGAIYRLVPLWRRVLAYAGPLQQSGPGETDGCVFTLDDNLEAPTVRIEFQVDTATPRIALVRLNNEPQDKFAVLECDPKLIETLARYCRAPQ